MKPDLPSALRERILIADGAMGTRLQALTGKTDGCLDGLNLDPLHQATVQAAHQAYAQAGADLIMTNTYGANPVKLARYGLETKIREICLSGARLAREAAGGGRWIGGSVGPLELTQGDEDVDEEQLRQLFREQMASLVEGGVDFLALETFQSLQEAQAALKEAATFGVPVTFLIGGVTRGRTGTGHDCRELATTAERLGASAIGANCRGPWDVLETVRRLAQVTTLPLMAMPNAGSPEIDRGRVVYNVDPGQFRDYARRFVEQGAGVLGGCCGTDPRHIQSLRGSTRDLSPPPRRWITPVRVFLQDPPRARADESARGPNPVEEVFRSVPFITSVEMRPRREQPLAELLEAGRRLALEGVHLFDVPDNAGAKVNVDPLVTAWSLQSATAIPTILHLSTSHRNLVAMQSYLLGAAHMGINAVLAVTGDHPNVGDHDKYASRVNDLKSSVNLLRLVEGLNQGHLFNRSSCLRCNFHLGGGFNPGRGLNAQVKWLERKIEAGARFIYTQPVFRIEEVDRMLEATAHLGVPILAGILPLTSRGSAEFFADGKIPGIVVPPEILERFQEPRPPHELRQMGLDMACELAQALRSRTRGLYIIPPFGGDKYALVSRILATVTAAPTCPPC